MHHKTLLLFSVNKSKSKKVICTRPRQGLYSICYDDSFGLLPDSLNHAIICSWDHLSEKYDHMIDAEMTLVELKNYH